MQTAQLIVQVNSLNAHLGMCIASDRKEKLLRINKNELY